VKNKIYAALAGAACAGALVAAPAGSAAATPHGSPYGTCGNGAYSEYSTCQHIKPKLFNVHAKDWWKGEFPFGFGVERASSKAFGLHSFKVVLPKGITWDRRTYNRDVSVSDKHTLKLENSDTLLVTLKSTDDKVVFSANSKAVSVDRSAKKSKQVTVRVDATDAGKPAKTYALSYTERAPKPKPVKKHHPKKHHKKK
jgi:hypothetical protein